MFKILDYIQIYIYIQALLIVKHTYIYSSNRKKNTMASSNALSFCFGSGESIVTFPTVRPNKKNQNIGPSATMFQAQQQQQSLNIYNRQFPKEIIGLIQSSRRTF